MDTLDLVLSNDGVLESTAVLDDEDGVLVATLNLTSAADTTAVGLHATIEGATDGLRSLKGDGSLGGGDGKRGALGKGEGIVRGGGGRASGDEARGSGNDGDRELHFDGEFVDLGCFGRSGI